MGELSEAIDLARTYLERALAEHSFQRLTISEPSTALRQELDELRRICGEARTDEPCAYGAPGGDTPGEWVRADLAEARRITVWVLERAKRLTYPPGVEGAVSRLDRRVIANFDRLDRSASGLE